MAILLPVFLFLLGINRVFAYSFMLGAAVFVVANLYFTAYAARSAEVQNVHWALHKVKRGQTGKFVLCAVGFAVVFHLFKPLAAKAVFLGFVSMVLLQCYIAAKLVAGKVFQPKISDERVS
ncbi:MAG: ATP synthase subunit I [Cellvibrionaceae bacterium]|nr:ATP synthase subunit I [Cellvibrionaceae bacterium]